MSAEPKPFDISGLPELVKLAEEVSATNESRELTCNGRTIALITPVRKAALPKFPVRRLRGVPKSAQNIDKLMAAAGGWADVDTDAFLAAIYESRDRISTRPVPDL